MLKSRHKLKYHLSYYQNITDIIGCIVCYNQGNFNNYISIHHINGRTCPYSHDYVLGLCADHHQLGRNCEAVHINKARFEKAYGKQSELFIQQTKILMDHNIEVPEFALNKVGVA